MDRIGAYSWHPRTDRWLWNEAMYRLLGYEPGSVEPSRALVVAHKHPDDRVRVERVMGEAVAGRRAYTCRHRILAVDRTVHDVVAVGYPCRGEPDDDPGDALLRGWLLHLGSVPGVPAGTGTTPWPASPRNEHDRILHRSGDLLARALHATPDAAGQLLGHLANTRQVPLIMAAEQVISASLDPDRPGLEGLLAGIDTVTAA